MRIPADHHAHETIPAFRRFNRYITRLLGLLNRRLLDSPLTLAEARTLHEIKAAPGISAAAVSHKLGMDRSQLSRILAKLLKDGLIERDGEPGGRKQLPLHTTQAGLALLADLDKSADRQAMDLLGSLSERKSARLRAALREVETLLGHSDEAPSSERTVTIRESRPGDLGWIIARHGEYYYHEHEFDAEFEKYVLLSVVEYLEMAPEGRRVWVAEYDGDTVGFVGVVEREDNRAQLRWLFVEAHARGLGVGRMLVEQALAFCRERGYSDIILWTIEILHPARALYASSGFEIIETCPCVLGGQEMTQECWALNLAGDSPLDAAALRASDAVRNGH